MTEQNRLRKSHQAKDGTLHPDSAGWYTARCTCGFKWGPAPDAEIVVDVLMSHAAEKAAE
jgi:hypothetical protein